MSLAYAILAMLTDRASSGYDLAKGFEGSVGYFWAATHQQIYRELAQLEAKGWVKSHTIQQDDRPNKKVFEPTPLGRAKMVEWMVQPSKPSKHKEEILVKLFAGQLIEPTLMIGELKRAKQAHQLQLQEYQNIAQQFFAQPETLPYGAKCQYLTLRQGISHETNWIEWCEEAITSLQESAALPSPI
jgi:DNA-binding PadR family transcriptional regulator